MIKNVRINVKHGFRVHNKNGKHVLNIYNLFYPIRPLALAVGASA